MDDRSVTRPTCRFDYTVGVVRFLAIAVAVAGCGRLGFDDLSDAATSGDAGVASVFATVPLPTGGDVTELERGADGTLYGIVSYFRVVRSTTGGATWTDCGATNEDGVSQIALDPTSGAIYLGGEAGVLQSTDDCATWTPLGLDQDTETIAVLNGHLFAGGADSLWVLSGQSWSHVSTPDDGNWIYSIATDPTTNHVLVAGDSGMALSIDGGLSFTATNGGLAGGGAVFVALDPAMPSHAVIDSWNGQAEWIYTSVDGGASWASAVTGGAYCAAFDPLSPSFAVLGAYTTGINTSVDAGMSFTTTDLRSAEMARAVIHTFVFDGNSGVYVGTGRGVFHAADHTLTPWTMADGTLDAWTIYSIAVANTDMYLGTPAGVLHAQNGGSWTEGSSGITESAQIGGIIGVPGSPGSIIASTANSVARSDDDGATFTEIFTPSGVDSYETLSVVAAGTRLVVGTPAGVEWADAPWTSSATFHSVLFANANALLVLAGDGTEILAGASLGVYYSSTHATSFVDISGPTSADFVIALAQLPDGTLFAGTENDGLYRASAPDGSWTQIAFASETVPALLVVGNRVFAATRAGVSVSSDDGATWQGMPGLGGHDVISLALDANGDLLAGTGGYGVYRAPI